MRILAFAILLCLTGCDRFTHTVKIPKQAVQAIVDRMVPVDLQEKADLPFPASLSTAEVILDEEKNQLGLRIAFSAEPPELPGPKPPGGPPPPFPGAPPAPQLPPAGEPIEGRIAVTGELSFDGSTGSFFFTNPTVQEVEGGDLPEGPARLFKEAAEKLVGKYLSENAVYTLDDDKLLSKAAKALLKSIDVKSDALHVTIGL